MTEDACFVVMPFGTKVLPGFADRGYDFDKVYRVLIQRAIRDAGMKPVRADEGVSSALIHTDMFRDLRDRPVVLADLSLDNPNVFYELGIRHVMSSSGTVLLCRKGSDLPFDVKLSRVIFYSFDGVSFDWEEVERVVKLLTVALQEARRDRPDSPVYALLERVVRERTPAVKQQRLGPEDAPDAKPLQKYQKMLADSWLATGTSRDVLAANLDSTFGTRAVGYYALACLPFTDDFVPFAEKVADHLNDESQYQLANCIYAPLHQSRKLHLQSALLYASSYSEERRDLAGADAAIKMVKDVLDPIEIRYATDPDEPQTVSDLAACYRRLGGLWQWKWQKTENRADLDRSIEVYRDAIRHTQRARELGKMPFPGFLAQARLKQMVLLRVRDQDVDRADLEGHRDAIVAMEAEPNDHPKGTSYLGWYQAIALADMGAADESESKALATVTEDAKRRNDPTNWEIGRKQYMLVRRFLEQYGRHLHHPTLIGRISQVLQKGM